MNGFLTVKQIANEYQISPATVYDWSSRRLFRTVKLNGWLLRIDREDFEKWMIEKRPSIYEQRRG